MEQFVEFVLNHWALWLALVGVVAMLVFNETRSAIWGASTVGPLEATRLLNRQNAIFVDVREEKEYGDGVLPNAVRIPMSQFRARMDDLDRYRDRPVIAYCDRGQRSSKACGYLRKQGFEQVHNLGGGIHAWRQANLPVHRN